MNDPTLPTPESSASLADRAAIRAAARAFFPDLTDVVPVDGRSDLARVETPEGPWRVRAWLAGTTEARLAAAHAAIRAARAAGLDPVPEVAALPPPLTGSVLPLGDRWCDAWRWLPGKPVPRTVAAYPAPEDRIDLPVVMPEAAFAETVEAIARLHAATAGRGRPAELPELPLSGLPVAVRQAWGGQRARLRPVAVANPPVQRWLALGERALPAAEGAVGAAGTALLAERAVVHLGLWPAHVLLEEGRVVGLLGWEAAASGPPLLDLAQAIVRLRGWSAPAAELAIAAYAGRRPLPAEARRLLPAVAVLDLVASAGTLLTAAYANPSAGEIAPTLLRQGANSLLDALEAAAGALAQTDTRGAGRRRREQAEAAGAPVPSRRTAGRSPRPPARGGPAPARPPARRPRPQRAPRSGGDERN